MINHLGVIVTDVIPPVKETILSPDFRVGNSPVIRSFLFSAGNL